MQNISSLVNSAEFQEEECPNCQARLPVYKGFVTWCDNCNWNIKPYKTPKPKNIFEGFYKVRVDPLFRWSPVQADALEAELRRFHKPVQEKLIDKLHDKLY